MKLKQFFEILFDDYFTRWFLWYTLRITGLAVIPQMQEWTQNHILLNINDPNLFMIYGYIISWGLPRMGLLICKVVLVMSIIVDILYCIVLYIQRRKNQACEETNMLRVEGYEKK